MAPIVIRELDKHKDRHPLQKLRSRARQVLADLLSKFTHARSLVIRPGVTLQFIADDPHVDFKTHRLHADVSDDWLIASMLEWRARHSGDPADDFPHAYGDDARHRQLRIAEPVNALDANRFNGIGNNAVQRIKQLERENADLRVTLPDLRLTFENGDAVLILSIATQSTDANVDIPREMARIRETYPYADDRSAITRETRRVTLGELAAAMKDEATIDLKKLAGPEEYKRYNQNSKPSTKSTKITLIG